MRFAVMSLLAVSALTLTACSTLDLGRDEDGPSARELGANCEPARASDPAAPGDWICPDEPGDREVRAGHRMRRGDN